MKDNPGQDTTLSWSSMREALAQVPALVAVTQGPEHQLIYSNDAYQRAFSPREVAPSDQPADAQPRLLDIGLCAPLDDVFTSGRSHSVRAVLRTPGAPGADIAAGDCHRVRHFAFGYAPLRDTGGQVTGILVVGTDESEQVRSAISSDGTEPRQPAASRALQRSLLTQPLHQPDELQVAGRYLPSSETDAGGDWYDVIPIGAGRTALVIGDVMGRGIHAAALMGQLRSALRAYARLDLPPAEVLGLLDTFVSDLEPIQIATCVYAIFDPVESLLSYSTAGHPPPLLRHPDGTVARLTAQPGAPLGVLGGPYPLQQVTVPAGAILLLYTDGLVERRGEDIEAGITALADVVRDADRPLEELADVVLQRLGPGSLGLDGTGPDRGDDDVALLLVRSTLRATTDSAGRSLRLQLNSGDEPARRARAYANGVLSAWRLPRTLREDIVIVVGELVANAVLHSGVAQELRLRRTPHRVVLEVVDRSARVPRPRPSDPEAESGRGLHLVAQLADRWGVRPLDGGKSVWCEFLA